MSSATPPGSLRELELEKPRRPLLRFLLYTPFVILLVLVAILAAIGFVAKSEARQRIAEERATFLADPSQIETLPATCAAPSFSSLSADIWSGDRAATSDKAYAEHVEASGMRVVGQNGFNFWGDEQSWNFSQALGRAPWLDDQLAQWLAYFHELDAQLEADGRELLIAVAPAKWELYREQLPEWTDGLQGETHLDQLLEHSGDLPIVDVREQMRSAKQMAPVFSAVNSHWTPFGAHAAWAQMVECGADLYPDSIWPQISVPAVLGIEYWEAPNEFTPLGDSSSPRDWAVPSYDSVPDVITSTVTDESGALVERVGDGSVGLLELPARTYSAGAGTALILRDSTGDALSPIWASSFGQTCQIRHNLDYPELRPDVVAAAEECGADTVIYVFTERYFAQTPPSL